VASPDRISTSIYCRNVVDPRHENPRDTVIAKLGFCSVRGAARDGGRAAFVTTELHAINAHIPASLVFCAAIFSGWFGGVGPGLVAAVISSVFILFNLIPSPYTVRSLSEEVIRVTIYSIAVFFVAW